MPMEQQHPTPQSFEGTPTKEQEAVEPAERQKTLAIRLDERIHAQLRLIAQLSDRSLTEEIRIAIDARIQAAQDDPALVARAHEAQHQIEREAAARSAALAGLIGKPAVATVVSNDAEAGTTARTAVTAGSSRSRRGKTNNG